jgi:hypothetical protein
VPPSRQPALEALSFVARLTRRGAQVEQLLAEIEEDVCRIPMDTVAAVPVRRFQFGKLIDGFNSVINSLKA